MPDEITDTTAPASAVAATTDTTAIAPEAKTFTQEQMNVVVQQRLAQDRQSRAKSEPVKSTSRDALAEIDALKVQNAELSLRGRFDKRIGKYDVTDGAAEGLFTMFKAQPPEDDSAWFDGKAKDFGMKPLGNPTQTAPVIQTAAAPNAPVKVDGITQAGITDVFNMSAAQLTAMGPMGVRAAFEQIIKVGNQMNGAPPRPTIGARK